MSIRRYALVYRRAMTEPEPAAAVAPPAASRTPLVGILATLLVASVLVNIVLLVQRREREKLDEGLPAADRERAFAADGKQTARFEYRGDQVYPIRASAFDRSGRVDSIAYDDNADGWYERFEIYTKNGLVTTQHDNDGDGVVGDTAVTKRNGVALIEFVDADGDRWQETARTLDAQGRPRLVMLDRDGDGMAERLQCLDANGVARELPLIDCPR